MHKEKIFNHVLFECMFMDCSNIWTKKSSKKLRLMAGDTGVFSLSTTLTDAGVLSKLIFSIQRIQQIDPNRIDVKIKKKKRQCKRGHTVSL